MANLEPLELLEEATQSVGAVVEGVVAREQLARLREQDDDHPHHDADGRAVDLGGFDLGTVLVQGLAMRLHEQLDGLTHALAERGREFRLALAAIQDRLE